MTPEEFLNDPELEVKSRIMTMMLNGTIDWSEGNHLRNVLTKEQCEELLKD